MKRFWAWGSSGPCSGHRGRGSLSSRASARTAAARRGLRLDGRAARVDRPVAERLDVGPPGRRVRSSGHPGRRPARARPARRAQRLDGSGTGLRHGSSRGQLATGEQQAPSSRGLASQKFDRQGRGVHRTSNSVNEAQGQRQHAGDEGRPDGVALATSRKAIRSARASRARVTQLEVQPDRRHDGPAPTGYGRLGRRPVRPGSAGTGSAGSSTGTGSSGATGGFDRLSRQHRHGIVGLPDRRRPRRLGLERRLDERQLRARATSRTAGTHEGRAGLAAVRPSRLHGRVLTPSGRCVRVPPSPARRSPRGPSPCRAPAPAG